MSAAVKATALKRSTLVFVASAFIIAAGRPASMALALAASPAALTRFRSFVNAASSTASEGPGGGSTCEPWVSVSRGGDRDRALATARALKSTVPGGARTARPSSPARCRARRSPACSPRGRACAR
eukprot:6144010-Prymnesium_polylepis.2